LISYPPAVEQPLHDPAAQRGRSPDFHGTPGANLKGMKAEGLLERFRHEALEK
jgi:hypothetical protein